MGRGEAKSLPDLSWMYEEFGSKEAFGQAVASYDPAREAARKADIADLEARITDFFKSNPKQVARAETVARAIGENPGAVADALSEMRSKFLVVASWVSPNGRSKRHRLVYRLRA